MDLPLPLLGIDYMGSAAPDFNYCRGSNNMWLSPDGYMETRPAVTRINSNTYTVASPVRGLYFSELMGELMFVRGHELFSIDTGNGQITEYGALPSSTNPRVCMVDYMGMLYIATGSILVRLDPSDPAAGVQTIPKAPDTADIPELDFLVAWQERLWGIKGETLWGSGYRTADDWGPADGSITTSLGGHLDVRYGDGAKLTGMTIYQGGFYLTKGRSDGMVSSFWEVTGSSFRAESTDPYSLHLVSNGVACVNPFTMVPTLNSVMFMGNGGHVYSEQSMDKYVFPQSVPVNQRVAPAFRIDIEPLCAAFQPMLGYYFLLFGNPVSNYYTVWAYHPGTGGWWWWTLPTINAVMVAPGPNDQLYFGDDRGYIYKLNIGYYGKDKGPTVEQVYSSGFSTAILDTASTRDKFFEWFYIDYVPIGHAGQVWLDYREGRGYTYIYTGSVFSDARVNQGVLGWDERASQWDSPEVGWDMGSPIERRNRVNRRASSMQISIQANTPFRMLGMALTGGTIAQRQRGWTKRGLS
jgi:hypothetical protein